MMQSIRKVVSPRNGNQHHLDDSCDIDNIPVNSTREFFSTFLFLDSDSAVGKRTKFTRATADADPLARTNKALMLHEGELGDEQENGPDSFGSTNSDTTEHVTLSEMFEAITPFVAKLKGSGIEVLKLGRQNKWQYRVLVASRETSVVSSGALLWLKAFDSKSGGLSRIKKQGRGGMYFTELMSTEVGFNRITVPPIPRRSMTKFPGIFGVLVTYKQDNGMERLLALAFKSQSDAEMFAMAMPVFKEVLLNADRRKRIV
jgi:hypothetical protein